MNQEELKNRYPMIAKKHPRTDLQPIYEIDSYVSQESRKKRELTAREIWIEIKKYPKKLVDKATKWLYESGTFKRRKIGSGFFFTEEKKDGTFGERYYDREGIDKAKEERAKEVVQIVRKNANVLDLEHKKHYQKMLISLKNNGLNLNSYNQIVEYLWSKGFSKIVKLFFKSGAYRYKK